MSKKFYFILIALLIFVNIPLLCTNIFATELQDSLFTLEEIVVIASKYPQELLTSIASVEIINKKDIEISKSENLSGIIKNIAGLEITDYGSPGDIKSVSIRGSSPEQVLIMIDGKVVNDPQTGKIDLGLIPVGMIEKIEIYRGPASALYGANALGGVINIITQGGGEEKKERQEFISGAIIPKNTRLLIKIEAMIFTIFLLVNITKQKVTEKTVNWIRFLCWARFPRR